MSKRREALLEEERKEARTARKWKRRIVAGGIALLVVALVLPWVLFANAQRARAELGSSLSEAERQLELREATEKALRGEKEGLEEKIADLLNVEETVPVITRDQLEEQLGSIRELVTQRYIYTNAAMREEGQTWGPGWRDPFGDKRILITYDGIIKAGIDLGEVEIDVDEEARTIKVTLPASKITDNNIPQETIDVLEVKDGLTNKVTFDDYNQLIGDEKAAMQEKAIEMGLLTNADEEAKAVVKAFLELIPGMDTYRLTIEVR